ncbi:MAG TPA: 4Fe-4S dicluster domain-containing protein [Bryobacteraceae bacterium]|nr:4Fe-4S dicluster domain-containing protein [Bryobacteraceae bacterium]
MLSSVPSTGNSLAQTNFQNCYQCGKCTAGCPVAAHMDVVPNQIVGLVQSGLADRAMRSEAIWQCVSCQTCTTRCPQSVDCAGVMDGLRQMSIEKNAATPAQQRTVLFQKAFLRNIRRNGRMNELELIAEFKVTGFLRDLNVPFLFSNAMLAPALQRRRKLHLMGEKVRDRGVVDRIFQRCLPEQKG